MTKIKTTIEHLLKKEEAHQKVKAVLVIAMSEDGDFIPMCNGEISLIELGFMEAAHEHLIHEIVDQGEISLIELGFMEAAQEHLIHEIVNQGEISLIELGFMEAAHEHLIHEIVDQYMDVDDLM